MRQITPGTSLDNLRKEAKRWLKALRDGDAEAHRRLREAWPGAPPDPGLRDVQHALALEHGASGWTTLRTSIDDARSGETPRSRAMQSLLRAADGGDVETLTRTLDEWPDLIDQRGTLEGHTGLRTALHFGQHHRAVVESLLARGADPNIRDEGDNAFPLHFAAERGDFDVIKLLIEHGADPKGEGDFHDLSVIGWATCFPGVEIKRDVVEYLLAHGARHTLWSAVATGDAETVRARGREQPESLERKMDTVNHRRHALHLAVVKDQVPSLEALLELGADPNAVDAAGLTPLDEAALRGASAMVQALLDRGARLSLASAIALGREEDIDRLIADDADALKPDGRWSSLIVRAATNGSAPVLERLIAHGASVDATDDPATSVDNTRGYTALHAAAFHGNLDAVEVLLKHGANPRTRDSRYGGTPAGWASYARKTAVFERLMDAPLDIFDAIDFDRPEKIDATLRDDPGALHRPFGAYLPEGALPAPWCPDPGITPLEWAAAENKTDAVRILASRGAELTHAAHHARTPEIRAGSFLRMACIDWRSGGYQRSRLTHAATRLLDRHPEIATADLFTAVACGELSEVTRRLAGQPSLANERGGPRGWPPLLYVCAARLTKPGPWIDHAIAIARLLLDHGADPNAYYEGGDSTIHYTALTVVCGRGEEQAAVHPRVRELAALLLERGAEPYDTQVLYNVFGGHASHRHLTDDDFVWLLELMHQAAIARGRQADWQDPQWPMLSMGGYGDGSWYLLNSALKGNYLSIARWVLEHGGSANPVRASDRRTPRGSLYDQAMRSGLTPFAELLVRFGAPRTSAEHPLDALMRAAAQADRAAARALIEANPELLQDPRPLHTAAEHDRIGMAEVLLDLGVSPDVTNAAVGNVRALHHAAYHDSPNVTQLLIARGAEIDPRDDNHEATPLYWAVWGGKRRTTDVLVPHSRDVWALVLAARVDRLRQIIGEEPRRATVRGTFDSPLFYLPDDEPAAAEIVELLLRHGADPGIRHRDGSTAAQLARGRGLTRAAELLERASDGSTEEQKIRR